jgi:DNA-binding GntR family transcriptional regulator
MIGLFMYDPNSPLMRGAARGDGPPAPEAKARFAEDRLLDAVIWCEVLPGETVTEADIMDRFGLTRAAARAGLARLGYDGWAQPQARAGWQVLPVTGKLIADVLAARRNAEPALGHAQLSHAATTEVRQIMAVLTALQDRPEAGALAANRVYVDRIDGILLGAINPFTARHLRKLWHHSARITRFLEGGTAAIWFHRSDVADLAQAILAGNQDGIVASRLSLIASQENFFLRQLLKSDAPLTPGSGVTGSWIQKAAPNRRET